MNCPIGIRKEAGKRGRIILAILSFALPLALWCAVSYIPFIYHPLIQITDAGGSMFCEPGDEIARENFEEESANLLAEGEAPMKGVRVNPAYLPAPHSVAKALVTAFRTPPKRDGDVWFYESILHSIKIVFLAFFLSSLVGLPLGILSGSIPFVERLTAPFIEFFRYFPAPVFGALAVAVLGINDAPKIAIIIIGTFFQQVPMLSATTRHADPALTEAARTLGASPLRVLIKVIIPEIAPKIYKDMRILLGWAWTYLIVAEVVGTSSGITWFINQQAKYRNFDNVYAAIVILGIIGLGCDLVLSRIGKDLFAWEDGRVSFLVKLRRELTAPKNYVFSFRLTEAEKELKEKNNGKL
ncbi:NitT/TauT family transport system permease protein [Fibrobacter intestinalis]|uniref:NitT/TauT family transport system permease protein n=1 Tax=Fibrobacter intestinalis TaxID=28122 RepID=A0A1T4LE80_9BACT|nr:NitT/TauT family transport system permease protein [Fibrobacter sp. NR9]SJZ53112.1 NitT/TauT family transport system permease protein [Fibrobacter intestinalis]